MKHVKFAHGPFLFLFIMVSFALSAPDQPQSVTAGSTPADPFYEPPPQDNRHIDFHPIDSGRIISEPRRQNSTIYRISPSRRAGAFGKLEVKLDEVATFSAESLVRLFDDRDSLLAVATIDNDGIAHLAFHGNRSAHYRVELVNVEGSQEAVASMKIGEIILGSTRRILLVGDSITAGKLASDDLGYRKYLFDMLKNARFDIDFVGDYGNDPYEGHYKGGRRINAFYPHYLGGTGELDMAGPMNDYSPNIVAIHLGTNDINNDAPAGPYEQDGAFTSTIGGNMAKLINYLLPWNNGEKGTSLEQIIVSLIIPAKYMDSTVYAANKEIARVVTDFQEGKITGKPEPVILCDHFTPFFEYPGFNQYYDPLMADKLHPTTTGHMVMAQTYFNLFSQLLSGNFAWFQNKSWETGITGADHNYGYQGVSIADLLDDGMEDIYIARANTDAEIQREEFYQNQGTRPFPDLAEALGIDDPGLSRNGFFFDMENDGDLDIFNAQYNAANTLYENLGGGQFREMAGEAGISAEAMLTSLALGFDCDNDGDTDILEVNSRTKNKFYINNGMGKFEQKDRGLDEIDEPDIPTVAAVACDYDNDDDIDVYIVKRSAANKLFRNDGTGFFTEVAAQAGIDMSAKCNGAFWADLDNDGDLDLLVTESASTEVPDPLLHIYRNNGDGTFTDLTQTLSIPMDGYSVISADFDNDGDLDIVTTNQSAAGEYYQNEGNWHFTKLAGTGAEINGREVRGAATFDYENDGDIDIVAARKGLTNVFLQNNLHNSNSYLTVKVKGPGSAAGGLGTKIWLYQPGRLADPAALLGYREILTVNGHLSQPSPTQHFGLGSVTACDMLARFTDGAYLVMRGVNANQALSIKPGPGSTLQVPERLLIYSGNAQADTVGKDLAEPLSVQVVNQQNQGVAGVTVDFTVTQGDAAIYNQTFSGEDIWLEAESASMAGEFRWAYDQTASGGGILLIPRQSGAASSASVSFNAAAGIYYGWIRIYNPLKPGLLTVDLLGQAGLSVPVTNDWVWMPITLSGAKKPFNLSGDHILQLTGNTAGLQIDKILFTKDSNLIPSGAGESGGDPNATDSQGIASRFVRLGTRSGPIKITAEATINGALQSVEFELTALPAAPAHLTVTGGNNQSGQIGEPLPNPLEVTLTDAFANPVPNRLIAFLPQTGGQVTETTVMTDSAGKASTVYLPGEASSLQTVAAQLQNHPQIKTTFQVFVQGVADSLAYLSGDGQLGTVGQVLAEPVTVQVLTDGGEPVSRYQLIFATEAPGGKVSLSSDFSNADSLLTVMTDTTGQGQVYWQLGTISGTQTLTINAGLIKNSPFVVTSGAGPGAPAHLVTIAGENQTAPIQQTLPAPFTVRLIDNFGNPTPEKQIVFQVAKGDGHFAGEPEQVVKTDSAGLATAAFTVGTIAGQNAYKVLVFHVAGNDTIPTPPLSFYAHATPGPAFNAEIIGGNNQSGIVNRSLPDPITVRISDEFLNPIEGAEVEFVVEAGDGSVDGKSLVTKLTTQSGTASATWILGRVAGANRISATARDLPDQHLTFMATGVADDPVRLLEISGNGQEGPKNRKLPAPLVVQVQDQYGNPIIKHPVTFSVQSENGRFGTATQVTVESDSGGMASAYLTLGSTLGDSNHVVHAASSYNGQPLENSPIVFYASAVRGEPYQLVRKSEQNFIGAANAVYPNPVKVQIVDEDKLPVDEQEVLFEIIEGDGTLLPGEGQILTLQTDANGEVQVNWRLGGVDSNHRLRVSALYGGNHLLNSPMIFTASAINTSAKSIRIMGGNNQTGGAGTPLSDPLAVAVFDNLGQPVANYPVRYRRLLGSGFFADNNDSEIIVNTDETGTARVSYVLGGEAGQAVQKVAAQSFSPIGVELDNSPLIFSFTATPGEFSADSSAVFATTPIPANGAAEAVITILVRDIFGNPIPQRPVEIVTSSNDLLFSALAGETNGEGLFTTTAVSAVPTTVIVTAKDRITGQQINGEASITFIATTASKAQKVSADSLLYPGSLLRDSLAVQIVDDGNQPVPEFPVSFVALTNNVKLLSPGQVYSDENGMAKAAIQALNSTGSAQVLALSPGLENDSLIFNLDIRPVTQLVLVALTPSLTGIVTETVAEGLVIKVTDPEERPVAGQTILVSTTSEQVAFPDSSQILSDSQGLAKTGIKLGKKAGTASIECALQGDDRIVSVPVTALADGPFSLIKSSGDGQQAPVTFPLPMPLTVQLTDQYGNPIPNRVIIFKNQSAAGGTIADSARITNEMGRASAEFTLAQKSGQYSIKAFLADSSAISTSFTVTALPLAARKMVLISGNNQQGITNRLLPNPVVLKVVDVYDNGVAGTAVEFAALTGNGHAEPTTVVSDTLGRATTQWTLGSKSGDQTLFAINASLDNSPMEIHAVAGANTPPRINVEPGPHAFKENQDFDLPFSITDAQNDSFTVKVLNLPDGAAVVYDSTFHIRWKPTYFQAGNYSVTINATDLYGAGSQNQIFLNVENVNRPPVISEELSQPTERSLGTLKKPSTLQFEVVASDPDNDSLLYRWYVNDDLQFTAASYLLRSALFDPGPLQVKVVVSDQIDSDSLTWQLDIVSSVELKYFSGQFIAFQGNTLNWETKVERDNLGFYVLRSAKPEGPFVEVSPFIAAGNGRYEFVDQEAEGNRIWYYTIEDLAQDGSRRRHDVIALEPELPRELALHQNYPNPFNNSTTIRVELPAETKIQLELYDLLGRRVKTLATGKTKGGYHAFKWDGRNEDDLPVASGVYYLIFQTPERHFSKKVLYLK